MRMLAQAQAQVHVHAHTQMNVCILVLKLELRFRAPGAFFSLLPFGFSFLVRVLMSLSMVGPVVSFFSFSFVL